MTWHTYKNYGSLLQAYALQEAFRQNNVASFLVDYDPRNFQRNEFSGTRGYVKYHARRLLKQHYAGQNGFFADFVYPQYEDKARDEAYHEFGKTHLRYTRRCVLASDFYELNEEYEILACGSDQIWAPTSFNPRYYLDFAKDPARTLAYAPSIGLPEIRDKAIGQQVARLAGRIAHLSIREQRGAEILESLLGVRPTVVLDPTALLAGEEWLERFSIGNSKDAKNPYAVCYFLSDDRRKWEDAQRIAKENKLRLLGIPVFKKDATRGVELCYGVGPIEFLSLIAGSSAVFTDSFHGTMFSLLFHKDLHVYKRFSDSSSTNQNSRISNILAIAGLDDSVLHDVQSKDRKPVSAIDWNEVDRRIESARCASKAFLSKSIEEISDHVHTSELASFPPTMTCCGCGGCVSACPAKALHLHENENGFFEAFINRNKCVECGICAKVCPFSNRQGADIERAKMFSYVTADSAALKRSASGGISNDLTIEALAHGCEVTGCALEEGCRGAAHNTISFDEGLPEAFQGSKYIQSNFTMAFQTLRHGGFQVVFGTPCQIAALRNILVLKGEEERYLLVDLICHGVPSAHLYRKTINEFMSLSESQDELLKVLFRDKESGSWQDMCMSIIGTSRRQSLKSNEAPFYSFFNQGNCYMDSCYECLWRKSSTADIRIGDYWGKRFSDNQEGVSMVLVFTEKGEKAVERLSRTRASHCGLQDISDYLTVQQIKNRSKPVHKDALVSELKDPAKSLKELEKRWCPERRIQESIRKAKRSFRR